MSVDDAVKIVALCGAMAGGINSFVVCPVELVKIKLQMQKQKRKYKGTMDCISKLVYKGGPLGSGRLQSPQQLNTGLFQGMVATIARESPSYGAQFFTYETLKRYIFAKGRILGPPINTKSNGRLEELTKI